jgi:hypothetical protein
MKDGDISSARTRATTTDRVARFLADPASYPHPVDAVEVCETHISQVFLAGPFAYKLKKPVDLGFVDYSTRERRRAFCEEELRLNRRLSPEVYLDVVSVREHDRSGALFLAGPCETRGREVEPLVRMLRVPAAVRLDSLVRAGAAQHAHIDRLLDRLVPFYREAPPAAERPGVAQAGTAAALRSLAEDNLDAAAALDGEIVPAKRLAALRSAQLAFLALHGDRFETRRREGRVRDGHGDLRCEHVAYLTRCVVLDCVEFDPALRAVDVAADLAFLAVDLEALGAPDLAEYLVERYCELSGDHGLGEVLGFYASFRACVRGKVDAIRWRQVEREDPWPRGEPERERFAKRARRCFELAHFHALSFHRPRLVLVSGLSGAGKSTLARGLAHALGAECLRSDLVRKELAGMRPDDPASRGPESYGAGIYSEAHTRRTYAELARRARQLLEGGADVIVDATFAERRDREDFAALARGAAADCVLFDLRAPEALALARIEARAAAGQDPSDATAAVRREQRARFESFLPEEAVPLDGSGTPQEVLAAAIEVLRRREAATTTRQGAT